MWDEFFSVDCSFSYLTSFMSMEILYICSEGGRRFGRRYECEVVRDAASSRVVYGVVVCGGFVCGVCACVRRVSEKVLGVGGGYAEG